MASVTQSIDVNVPVRTAYDQWTQFEEFPRFMEASRKCASSTTERWSGRLRSAARKSLDGRDHRAGARQRVAWRASPARRTPAWSRSNPSPTTGPAVTLQME